ncbi:uncharacterized protein LOC114350564 isoform X7 [Ostrinia furnacalis]|uniref:uncharacterized protein LOC114350564 isoform X7 n=1 Tax=Ostrinia furnacalis TaxID=93504 RepID=UPI00103DF774|nr:uncharacterized protein LOC114350564 isoform X7 [Ostrinia furnacalis]
MVPVSELTTTAEIELSSIQENYSQIITDKEQVETTTMTDREVLLSKASTNDIQITTMTSEVGTNTPFIDKDAIENDSMNNTETEEKPTESLISVTKFVTVSDINITETSTQIPTTDTYIENTSDTDKTDENNGPSITSTVNLENSISTTYEKITTDTAQTITTPIIVPISLPGRDSISTTEMSIKSTTSQVDGTIMTTENENAVTITESDLINTDLITRNIKEMITSSVTVERTLETSSKYDHDNNEKTTELTSIVTEFRVNENFSTSSTTDLNIKVSTTNVDSTPTSNHSVNVPNVSTSTDNLSSRSKDVDIFAWTESTTTPDLTSTETNLKTDIHNKRCDINSHCPLDKACLNGVCQNPCEVAPSPCTISTPCKVVDHAAVCVCDHEAGDFCRRESPGTPKAPEPCQSDRDCIESEACFMGICQNPCEFNMCGTGANCQPVLQRPMCSCPAGYDGDPAVKCSPKKIGCTRNEDCQLTEACINNACQHPCAIHNPCAQNAVCINTNHGSDCSCVEGYQGNGYVGCVPVNDNKSVCQYNEDCPPELLCDRLNRVCINPCTMNKCGDNAECIPAKHGIECKCYAGYTGNPFLECYQVQGCRTDNECANSEACINGKCGSPCRCGANAICDVLNHRATCKCLPGYNGNPTLGCEPPRNPCIPNPCGINALCESDSGNPICYCPKGLTGNPFKNCIPEGNECEPNPCGPYSGCRLIDNRPACFCLPNYEGNPPAEPCRLPSNPCNPSPCGPNTQCTVLSNGFAKCTCLDGYIESPNTVRGCIEARNPCEPNTCGIGARCDPNRTPACYCPDSTVGNPYKSCNKGYLPPAILCQPGPCGPNADCYVSSNTEMCFCKTNFIGNPYTGCQPRSSPCTPNPCGPQAICDTNYNGQAVCTCVEGSSGDPYGVNGCHSRECEVDTDCSKNKACIGYTCRDPCPGVCGLNAKCHVELHRPVCTCEDGLIGNPFICCLPPEDQKSIRPCNKVECGINAMCQDVGDEALCHCPPDFFGDPTVECKPQCLMNSDCPSNEACVNNKCQDPCTLNNICGINAVCLCSDHTVSCLCPDGYIGDPMTQCIYRPILIPPDNTTSQPCSPNPCDPNAPCDTYGNQFAICDACVGPDSVNNPACRPECILSSDCAFNKACLRNRCVDPCPGSCGIDAECMVYHHDPICRCPKGFQGNPYELCKLTTNPVEQENCDNVRCGDNAICQEINGALTCTCLPNFFGNPYLSCRPECVVNSDCSPDLACLNNKCEDPCHNVCGLGALCKTVNHHAVCYCEPGFTGDPYIRCQSTPITPPVLSTCDPSPCGPYSRCLISPSGFAVCSCLPGHRGVAPMCQPECVSNSDCQQTEICVNQRCSNPCQGSCGVNAECITINHNPICSCGAKRTGDPFVACTEITDEPVQRNPCVPSPCGPNSVCEVVSDRPVCSCRPNYSGTPPYCRPECVISQECPSHQACINEKCVDPCTNACGNNAKCNVVNHTPLCSCLEGYKGDAFVGCVAIPIVDIKTPCEPSPCGENTICTVVNDVARCSCIPPNIGNPYAGGCRPECSINSDCPNHLACLSNHCRDPCKDLCGVNAECTVTNHVPVCTCFKGYEGNPFSSCREEYKPPYPPLNPCEPSPCGPNSECNVVSDRPVCVCQPGFLGAPPACRPECAVNSDCPANKACINLKCKDPCVHSCGLDARCHVVGHNPICTCPENLPEGDPFIRCFRKNISYPAPDPCLPSPCGPYSTCRNVNGRATCSCEPGMLGAPPTCRRQCVINQDCPLALACLSGSCVNPCVGSCGFNARCIVQNHQPICSCDDGYSGDPFAGCSRTEVPKDLPRHPCNPSPCGPNAICRERDGAGSCTCIDEFYGDPYLGCRPECVMNTDCAMDRSCFNNKCVDPCSGACGQNAECRVTNHAPSCSCLPGYNGNPLHACTPVPILQEPVNPCQPSPCGPYSKCRIFNGHAVCTCLDICVGSPPNCRPECIVSSDCRSDKACINQKCQDPCAGMCGIDAQCQVVNHNPICSCLNGYTGDPFVKCFIDRPMIPINSCIPSPCGPNSQCNEVNGVPVCSCLRNYVGRPPNCRPECVIDVECPGNLACISEICSDPCPGSCGFHATCTVVKHVPICTCDHGYTGDPFSGCSVVPPIEPQVVSPCSLSPCGANAVCKERHGIGSCSCLPDYYGDPYIECRPECVLNSDCPKDKACVNNKCKDPCPGVCGMYAECRVNNHAPSCACLPGYEGNPFTSCYIRNNDIPTDPCSPSPCGPYSICRVSDSHAICSCQEQYFGSPPFCRPECMVSSECMPNKACINQKCVDPCIGACGNNAKCTVVNHNALCSCPQNYIGDPFVQCTFEKRPEPRPSANPCVPSPCGPNSQCRIVGETPACSCQPGYIGRAPNCRPECIYDEECPSNLACIREKCVSPCEGSCGSNAECVVINHKAVCHCRESYTGDPFSGCRFIVTIPNDEDTNPCNPSPCGPNSLCTERNNAGACTCQPGYFGDPYLGCRPECVTNNDCPLDKSCSNNKCINPCQGACGINAQCTVAHHTPVCLCIEGYEGNPASSCHPQRQPSLADVNPCVPSPCGPYSTCKEINGHGVCSCQDGYSGLPPTCRPECVISTDCPQHQACIRQKCKDPCPGTCGVNARCQTINHNPICTCKAGFTGDPFVTCHLDKKPISMGPKGNPCVPSPCGPYSQCKVVGEAPACSCLPNYIGVAPNCRPECSINAECPGNLACQNERCVDPCPGSCGFNAECSVATHVALCNCIPGYTGDPFSGCSEIERVSEPPPNPCNPSPCGANALCKERNGIGSCTCLPEYFGDPYTGCRPECVSNSDCDRNKACSNNRCKDPCPGACGINAECRTVNHSPICTCLTGYSGNPLVRCEVEIKVVNIDPCQPSPCGPNSLCRVVNGHSVCTCDNGYIGTPPSCRPECIVSSECPQDKACVNKKCIDPCPNTCGLNARCQVITHNPICSCTPGYTGDPFTRCDLEGKITNTTCSPSPCGPNSECRVIGDQAACSCLPNYIGRVPNCRPECTIDAECPSNTACINERCKNPCQGACGVNAICLTVYHKPVCSCQDRYTGDAYTNCIEIVMPESAVTPSSSPCSPSPCGPNAECREHNGAGACVCSEGYEGDPYSPQGCRRECENNDECSPNLACIRFKCIDPCPRTCGQMAQCIVENHVPICTCPRGYSGDPFFECKRIVLPPAPPQSPCEPTPCGPNSVCQQINMQAVCSCLPNYVGLPPSCRPECVVNSECDTSKACINQRCDDPCPNTCGLRAHCLVRNHNPICTCPGGMTGDPFTQCYPIEPITERPPSCTPSPCGPNSRCQLLATGPACSCLPGYTGSPPACRPECTINSECPASLACLRQKCEDPCPGSCGIDANCHVLNHVAVCVCNEGYTGDPFTRCLAITEDPTTAIPSDPCNPSPCGPNAQCDNGLCTCLLDYTGNPYESCRPECTGSQECPRDKACFRNKCRDPCPGVCGQNTKCDVINHIPTCSCIAGFTGNPFIHCQPIEDKPAPRNPCNPSICGPNSLCRLTSNNTAACACIEGFQGSPPMCKPECVVSSECPSTKACINQKCINPCINACGVSARCEVINHSPICSCNPGQTGDPFKNCYDVVQTPPEPVDICNPSPCGPNSLCIERNGKPKCRCVDNYIGQPPNCRPECVINSDCPSNQACVMSKCIDPCPGSCGINADCIVVSHMVSCICREKYTGNPFLQCIPHEEIVAQPCDPSPCGANAICNQRDGAGSCSCLEGYQGNPYEGCRPECVLSSDCSADKACIRNKCANPCPGICGANAECSVINHVPSCACITGYSGNPFEQCKINEVVERSRPCQPSPCGPNSICRENGGLASCECLPDYRGAPPDCRPECTVSSECPSDRACHRMKCADPCRGTCGIGAHCQVINHSPLCSCPIGTSGDPFTRCYELPDTPPPVQTQPCQPNPCGPYSECRPVNGNPSCSCSPGYTGIPPNCHPECLVNTDCPSHQACIAEKCTNPCEGSCGFRAECRVHNHIPLCSCPTGYSGDPFIQCMEIIVPPPSSTDPCNPSPCGSNANCDAGVCTCATGYFGDPYAGCRHECSTNGECSPTRACQGGHCIDPCPGACGTGARCTVNNHIPSCTCPSGTSGDPFSYCTEIVPPTDVPGRSACSPSPCGPYSECTVSANGAAACSCRAGHIGSPPSCRPECLVSSECKLQQACIDRRCRDPCEGACGRGAQCNVIAHSPICTCNDGYTGDPFTYCYPAPALPEQPVNPCEPSPCGPNSICVKSGETPACSCQPGYIGSPPNCRPECTISAECPAAFACVALRCKNPCEQACGPNAICSVVDHRATCACEPGLEGDPFQGCSPPRAKPPNDPCSPSPCGPGAICRVRGSGASCECETGLHGDPYTGCRPECLSDSDCSPSRACIRSRCREPCQGTCGVGADCETVNHIPLCSCPPGTRGNAFEICEIIKSAPPCTPSPCGPGALCTVSGNNAVCSCPSGTSGDAASGGCRPECVVSSECARDRACVRNKCVNPCEGACGLAALCRVIDHAPICSCPSLTTGDPFLECRPTEPIENDPCDPNPCGPHGTCRNGFCTYPECIVNDDCPGDRACINRKCTDPCINACGLNALCTVVRHAAVCSCPAGYTGSAFVRCERIIIETPPPPKPECVADEQCPDNAACVDSRCSPVCGPTNCGINARCLARQHRARCACLPGYEGDAYRGCYSVQCHSNNDCPDDESCESGSCIKVCTRIQCGTNAHCVARGHTASCECDSGARGNPWTGCQRSECVVDDDCASWLACRSGVCQDPCPGACAQGALCTVNRHAPVCECPRNTQGDPKISCQPVLERAECEKDADCGPGLACLQGNCKNPCETTSCGTRAVCRVANTLPFRTLVCECPRPLTGDASVQCNPRGECSVDSECGLEERCLNGRCIGVCEAGVCGTGAECRATNHVAECRCIPPLQGDPRVACSPASPSPECTTDSECGAAEACVNRRCVSACAGACGSGALCTPLDHRAACRCPPGTAGDPSRLCYTPECTTDDNCPFDKTCVRGYCQDPCALGTPCGRDAVCEAVAHVASCRCPPGTQGDPRRACISAICHYNEDCDDTQTCNRLNRVCQPACTDDACAPGATCTARDHRPVCTCRSGLSGDPYLQGCGKQVTTECVTDSDCASPLACVNARCTDLCLTNPCDVGLICKTVDILPLRAVACVCPDGGRVAPDSGCRSPPEAECSADLDCALSQVCRRGSCVDACRVNPCGQNALCESVDHAAHCTCPQGYYGNPKIECNVEPRQQVPECYSDDECSTERACRDRQCVNPCANACGPGALCRVIDHKPQCSCPSGYSGVATRQCVPPAEDKTVGCKANSECPLSQACVNGACANPCACGTNAECSVIRHHPVCYCASGFSGNPYIGCRKVGCSSDSECSDSDTCYNGACVNPCVIDAPCAISAECYGKSHRANCRCPAGTIGDPYTRCKTSECEINSDCNDDSVCINGVCLHACSAEGQSPCSNNAECFARNHAASCRCPAALPSGDPLTHCMKIPVIGEPECRVDSDCPSKHACLRDQCREACSELKPCNGNARCSVSDSIPFRTLLCRCPEGYLPDEAGSCKSAQLPAPSCSSDQDCSDQESCVNRICRNPCNCGENAECFIRDHRPVCSCRDGFDGDPYRVCRIVGCRTDSECESNEACVNGNCISPCLLNSTCGANADCLVERNRPLCRCRNGFEGDARVGCNPIECRTNSDCPLDKQCHAHRCINPCLSGNTCGRNAKCLVPNHIAVCKCDIGYIGSPYVECRPETIAECYVDADCPPKSACLSSRCVNPCTALHPCSTPARCEVSPTLPVRTMICTCPPGYVSNGGGICRPATPISDVVCEIDTDCTSNHACITSICKNPCDCGPNTDCLIKEHKPVCACRPGYIGDARTGCYKVLCRSDSQCSDDESCINNRCVPACSVEPDVCGSLAECYGLEHRAACRCKIGTTGNPTIGCTPIGCRADSDCPLDRSCINTKCVNPCNTTNCREPAECRVHLHEAHCVCPPGYRSTETNCEKIDLPQCVSDVECPSGTVCLNAECVNPCQTTKPCGTNAECTVVDTLPVRTMICECIPGYRGNALVECTPNITPSAACVEGQGLNALGECAPCRADEGRTVDSRGRCVCDTENGWAARGGVCVRVVCSADRECDDRERCINGVCIDACEAEPCGQNAICNAYDHRSHCTCTKGYTGNPRVLCNETTMPNVTYRTDFPLPEMQVNCLANGIRVSLKIKEGFNGLLYVKGYSKDERCGLVVNTPVNQESPVDFTVHFGNCGLVHVNGLASFVLVMQDHLKLVTSNAKAFHIKCIYQTGEKNVTLAFNVSMLTTAGTIANTGPPPVCSMRIVTRTGDEVNSATVGENLTLQVDVQPSSIYGGFARSCIAKTSEVATNVENEYTVTDADGCATDPSIFGEWEHNDDGTLKVLFNAFKFPSSDNIRFQCNIRICFGKCQPVNCRGRDAYGKRRKRETRYYNEGPLSGVEGQMREEVTVESNQILTIERRSASRAARQREGGAGAGGNNGGEVCVSAAGLAVALALTALLALVAVAAAVACWLVAWRRARPPPAPLPHPPDFPNPLFQR